MSRLFERLNDTQVIRRWADLEVLSARLGERPCLALHTAGSQMAETQLRELARLHRAIEGTLFPSVLAEQGDAESYCVVLDAPAVVDLGALWQWARRNKRVALTYAEASALGLDLAIALGRLDVEWGRGLGSLSWANLLADADGGIHLLALPGSEVGFHRDASVHMAPEVRTGATPTSAADVWSFWAMFLTFLDVLDVPQQMMDALAGRGDRDSHYTQIFLDNQRRAGAISVAERIASPAAAVPMWEEQWDALGIGPDHRALRETMAANVQAFSDGQLARPTHPSIGGGRFELRRLVGSGSTGSVWEGHDRNLGETVAIKRLRNDVDDSARRRFKREASLLRRIRHPAVIQGYDYFEEEGTAFAVMRYVDGPQLDAYARGLQPDVERITEIVVDVASGLAALHSNDVIHRDVKPSNVLVEGDGNAVLVDLGVAIEGHMSTLTTTAGSLRFMSPEQRDGGEVGWASDIYSLGVTWWATLRWAAGDLTLHWPQLDEAPLAGLELAPQVGEWLLRCLSKPQQRPSADALVRGLLAAPQRPSSDAASSPVVRIGPDARWVELPDGTMISLGRRVIMRRLLETLIGAHGNGGGSLSAERLLAAGWPDEKMSADSGRNRLYVTMSRMRKLGFDAILVSDDTGWSLAPKYQVVLAG